MTDPVSPVVTYLGPSGTFTHQAVLALRPGARAVPVDNQGDALAAVEAGEAAYAVLPIDNSVNGVVVPTLDALLQHPGVEIVDSVALPISFDAYTVDPAITPTVVVSHPHGLAQCRDYVASLGLPVREAASTAAACRDLVPGEIGIGTAVVGSLYPIQRVREAVEDHAAATTQFALVADVAGHSAAPVNGASGMLVALWPRTNTPGLLRRFLGVLEDRGVNMTNLVTRPVPATPGLFVFLLFLAGSFGDDDVAAMRAEWADLDCDARPVGRISPLADLAPR